nr:ribonuclease H-like domain-containing protein [Tanacetum cinerariifolium]
MSRLMPPVAHPQRPVIHLPELLLFRLQWLVLLRVSREHGYGDQNALFETMIPEPQGNPQQALKDKGVIDSRCSRHMTRNMSYLSDFEELNGEYVSFGGNPKGGKITSKSKIKTGKLDLDDVYFVKELKFNLFSVSQMCDKKNSVLFADTECLVLSSDFKLPDESQVLLRDETSPILKTFITGQENQLSLKVKVIRSDNGTEFKNNDINQFCGLKGIKRVLVTKPRNKTPYELLHGRTRSIGFMRSFGCSVTILNTLDPLGKFQGKVDEGFLVGYSEKVGEEVDQQYVLFPVWSFGSTNPQNNDEDASFDGNEHDFDAKKPESEVIVSSSSKFEDCSNNSSNEVNAAGSIVYIVGQNSFNSTNTFSVAGPSNTAVSPTYGKSSFIDTSQLPDDPDMPELEDITYSDDEDVVGAEANFNNLESYILVRPIPTIRIHKDHLVSQIIGDLSLTAQTISMTRAVKDQGGLSQMFANDFHTCMFSCFLLQEEPKRVKQNKDGIFISQDKYIVEILRKFELIKGKSGSTPIDTEKHLLKDPDGEDVDVHTYRSMIDSLMYLTSSRPDIMFTCKKQTVVATSSTEAEYVAAASCCAQDNDVTRLQALVDRKKVVIIKAAIQEVLRLDDAEGVDYQPNEEIFAELARMAYENPSIKLTFYKVFFSSQWKFLIYTILQSMSAKRISWNEFISPMESAVICLSTSRKFNFYKYIFDSMVRNVDSTSKFYMYPRFIQFLIRKQLGDLLTHTIKYTSPALTQKVFANIRRVGKGFSGVETPLFEGMLVEGVIQEGALDACAALTRRIEHLEYDKVAQAMKITKLKKRVKKLEKENKVKVLKLRRLKKVETSQRIDTSEDTVMEDASNQERMIDDLDKDDVVALMDDKEEDKGKAKEDEPAKIQEVVDVVTTAKLITEVVTAASETVAAAIQGIMVEEPKPLKKKQQVEMDKEYARKLHAKLNKDIDWDVAIEHVKQKAKEDPDVQRYQVMKKRPQTEAQAQKNIIMYFENKKEQMKEEESRALQSINETPAQKAAKRRKLNEEVEDLKRHLEIVPNEDDEIYTEATPLARKDNSPRIHRNAGYESQRSGNVVRAKETV